MVPLAVDHRFKSQTAVPVPVYAVDPVSRAAHAEGVEKRSLVLPPGRLKVSWWLWPHVVSLDAPTVAVIWQWAFARAFRIDFFWADSLILGLGVWMIYLGDRLVDAARASLDDASTARHAIHARWRGFFSTVALIIVGTLVVLAPCLLPPRLFLHGLCLLGAAGAYFWFVHGRTARRWTHFFPKEAAVGSMFAAGTAFLPWDRSVSHHPWAEFAVALFGGLCFCNCALITVWERHAVDIRDHTSFLNAFPRLSARLPFLCLALALGACWGLSSDSSRVFLALIVSSLCLALLDQHRGKLSPDLVRVLADAALLTPLLFNACGHG